MKKDFKRFLMGKLKLKHQHPDPFTGQPSMKEALKCKQCGEHLVQAETIYKQRRKDYPEEFVYKEPEFKRSPELLKDYEKLFDRVKKDKLYKRHLERLASGTEKEKDEEIEKSNKGYYQEHYYEDNGIKKINKNDTTD